MQTPFDPALRIQQRALDAIRISLLAETARELALADERNALDAELDRETAIAATNWQVGAHPYGQRVRARRIALEKDRRAVDGRLQRLRGAAMEACGQMLAITEAATNFATDLRRRENASDLAHVDDLNGALRHSRHDSGFRPMAMNAAAAR